MSHPVPVRRSSARRAAFFAVALLAAGRSRVVQAGCNLIPLAPTAYRAALGGTDRPFAAPGEPVNIRVDRGRCDTTSPGFSIPAETVVTVIFTPPGTGTRNARVLKTSCARFVGSAEQQACQAALGGGSVTCEQVDPQAGRILATTPDVLTFSFPDTDVQCCGATPVAGDGRTFTGPATIAVTRLGAPLPCQLSQSLRCASSFGTQGLVACVDDFYTRDGTCRRDTALLDPAFASFTALPPPTPFKTLCQPPSQGCVGGATELRFAVDLAGNAFLPVDWRDIIVRQGGSPTPRALHASTTVEARIGSSIPITIPGTNFLQSLTPGGGLLGPIFDQQADPSQTSSLTLFGSTDAPYTVLRGARRAPVCSGTLKFCRADSECPSGEFCTRFVQCLSGDNAGLPCTEDRDCPNGSCGQAICHLDGVPATQPCVVDTDCPAGQECGPELFDFRTRMVAGTGPIVLPAGLFTAEAGDPFTLNQAEATDDLRALVSLESAAQKQLNADSDQTDAVITLANRRTGMPISIAPTGGPAPNATGRAVTEVQVRVDRPNLAPALQRAFSFPAFAVESDFLAFLQSEPHEAGATAETPDTNANAQIFDSVLRVYQLISPTAAAQVTPAPLTADAAPVINGNALAFSDGVAFFRGTEAGAALKKPSRESLGIGGAELTNAEITPGVIALSKDGNTLLFTTADPNVIGGDGNAFADLFARDLTTGINERVSADSAGGDPNAAANFILPAVSANGRYVAFSSPATDLVPGVTSGLMHVYVRDLLMDTTVLASKSDAGIEGDENSGQSGFPYGEKVAISATGRYVAFPSSADNLDSLIPDSNGFIDAYVVDLDTNENGILDDSPVRTRRMSLGDDNLTQGNGQSSGTNGIAFLGIAISASGRYVAFGSQASNLLVNVPPDTNGVIDVYVRDRDPDENGIFDEAPGGYLRRVSVASDGTQGIGGAIGFALNPTFTPDGRYVFFNSDFTNLVPASANNTFHIYMHDQLTHVTTRETLAMDGGTPDGPSGGFDISADGRYLAFCSEATNLVPNDTNLNATDIFLRDRVSGQTTMIDLLGGSATPSPGNPPILTQACQPVISGDGRIVGFTTSNAGMTSDPDTNGFTDVFLRRPHTLDCGADLTGDCDLSDTVLEAFYPGTGTTLPVCPADQVAVAGGLAAFLRPESGGDGPTRCPAAAADLGAGKVDINGDGDGDDHIVHAWRAVPPDAVAANLTLAASQIAVSGGCSGSLASCVSDADCPSGESCVPLWLAALASESETGANLNGSPFSDDIDPNDTVVHTRPISCSPLATCATWTNWGQAADALDVQGNVLAFLEPEIAQGAGGTDLSLNGQIGIGEKVLRVLTLPSGPLRPSLPPAAYEFVLGSFVPGKDQLVAFRRNDDQHLQVYDVTTDLTYDTGLLVIPCQLEACDPTKPYRVFDATGTVRFLTTECEIGQDMNHSGGLECNVVVVAVWTLSSGTARGIGVIDDGDEGTDPTDDGDGGGEHVYTGDAGRCFRGAEQLLVPESCLLDDPTTCPSDAVCMVDQVTVSAPDTDGDGIPDAIDNCPYTQNAAQADTDGDGVGDACDLQTCGDTAVGGTEQCDDGNQTDGDGCSSSCQPERRFRCYKSAVPRGLPKFIPPPPFVLTDQFDARSARVSALSTFCAPNGTGGPLPDPAGHLQCYKAKDINNGQDKVAAHNVAVQNEFGATTLTVSTHKTFCVPSAKDGVPFTLGLDRFKCYKATTAKGAPHFLPTIVPVSDVFAPSTAVKVVKPTLLCTEADRDGLGVVDGAGLLTCYKTTPAPGQPSFPAQGITVQNEFGGLSVNVSKSGLLCVPTWR